VKRVYVPLIISPPCLCCWDEYSTNRLLVEPLFIPPYFNFHHILGIPHIFPLHHISADIGVLFLIIFIFLDVFEILGTWLQVSLRRSVCQSTRITTAPTPWISHVWVFLKNWREKSNLLSSEKDNAFFRKDICKFIVVTPWGLIKNKNDF